MKLIKGLLIRYVLGLLGIILVVCAPSLISPSPDRSNVILYINSIKSVFEQIINPNSWVIKYWPPRSLEYIEKTISEFFWDNYLYSLMILGGAFLLAFVIALFLGSITLLLPKKISRVLFSTSGVAIAFPDLLFLFLLQIGIVWIYKQTNVLIMDFVYMSDERIYLAPIVALSILPTIFLYRNIYLLLKKEIALEYSSFAQSKGLSYPVIIIKHCLRNIASNVFYQSKAILWMTLSSLLVVETIFRIPGITQHISFQLGPFNNFLILAMLFTPFYVLYYLLDVLLIAKISELTRSSNNKTGFISDYFFNIRGKPQLIRALKKLYDIILKGLEALIVYYKKPGFAFGFTFIAGLLITSVIYTVVSDEPISQTLYVYSETGDIESAPPHPPSGSLLLGSDVYGYSILQKLVVGAKYTIFFSLLIGFLRVFSGYILGVFYTFFFSSKIRKVIKSIADGMQFLPLSIIAYLMLKPVLFLGSGAPMLDLWERILFEVIVLTLLVLPVMVNVIGNDMVDLTQKEYVEGAKVIGASNFRILMLYITPNILPRLIEHWGQHTIQTLYIFIHLGLFNIFFGGTILQNGAATGPPVSATAEWSGLVALSRDAFMTGQYWLVLSSLALFMIFILSIQSVINAVAKN